MSDTISVTEFKAKCLDLIGQISRHEVERLVITKRGKPVAVVSPAQAEAVPVESLFGWQRGSVIIPEGFDLTESVFDGQLDAEQGILHR